MKIYLSHSWENESQAREIAKNLVKAGHEVIVAADVRPTKFPIKEGVEKVRKIIAECDIVMVVV